MRNKPIPGWLPALLLFLPLLASCDRELGRTEFLLGTTCTIRTWGGRERDLDRAFERIDNIEQKMSAHLPDSEINRIVSGDPEGTVVSEETLKVIARGLEFGRLSGGLLDITTAPITELWGFGSDQARVPNREEIDDVLDKVDYRKVGIIGKDRITLDSGQRLDLGALAKGYAADEAARILEEAGVSRALINLGGNVITVGRKKDGNPWRVGIQDPFETTGSAIGIMEVTGGAVVTSGIYERFIEQDGKRYHHILDPRTGMPYDTDLAAVSVCVPEGLDADGLSTSLFLLGIDRGCELLASFPESGAVFITVQREVVTAGTASSFFTLTNQDYRITERR